MKAVVMAGGSGTRLRPLTCDLPKPLVPVCGKPVLEYIFDLLLRAGVHEAALTLGYLPQCIEQRYPDRKYKDLALTFLREQSPLGTAGGVRAAAEGWDEPFFVLSGDAMCDFDLDKIMRHHQSQAADVTIVCVRVDDPREYGLVEKDDAGRVLRFLEKPDWGQATTDLANTGVYVLEPALLRDIPPDVPCDFAKDLFPRWMQAGKGLYAYHAEGYWKDVGDITSFLACTRDLLRGRIQFPLHSVGEGIFAADRLPAGEYTIVPPVYIGARTDIAPGAVIGPYTCLEEGCAVGRNARLRQSVLLPRARAEGNADAYRSLLCADASLGPGANMYEQSVLGSGARVGSGSTLRPGVRVWPGKEVSAGITLAEDLRFGERAAVLFGENEIRDASSFTASMCAALGEAIGSVSVCKKAAVGCDGSHYGKAMLRALESGLLTAGGHVWDFGECFPAQLAYCTAFCGLTAGIYFEGGAKPAIRICGEGGLPVSRAAEREITSRMVRAERNRCLPEHCRDVADMRSIRLMYGRELLRQAPSGLRGMRCAVQCENKLIRLLMEDTLLRLGCLRGEELLFRISADGTQCDAVEQGVAFSSEKLLTVCCDDAFSKGSDVALPYDAPVVLDTLAANYGRQVRRYLSVPSDGTDAQARSLAQKQFFLRDGLYRTIRVLSILREKGQSLQAVCASLPDTFTQRRTFSLSFSPAKLLAMLEPQQSETGSQREGVAFRHGSGRLLVTPTRDGHALHVLAEAHSMEAAEEMCSGFERLLREMEEENANAE